MRKDLLAHYLARRAVSAPWRLEGDRESGYDGCVVIPALAESERLFATLDSLAANPAPLLERFLVVVVVNQREDAAGWEKADNAVTLARLRRLETPLRLCLVDAAGDGLELAAGAGGVGLARKIGLDLALPRLREHGIMVCLDADTLVEPEYLGALTGHFARTGAGGAVIPFRHQRGASEAEDRAITLYELYLRHYVLGLEGAGSPYAFHCVGSAMACTVRAYLRMGGITPRQAGEDFYFLQQLKKTSGIAEVRGTTVHPSARCSHRVPFGTGKSISKIVAEGEEAQTFYHPACYRILGEWLRLIRGGLAHSADRLLREASGIEPELEKYLAQADFARVWERLRANHREEEALLQAFHGWFDSLKTVRLVHHLSQKYPRGPAHRSVPQLLEFHGVPAPAGEAALLRLLRAMQSAP